MEFAAYTYIVQIAVIVGALVVFTLFQREPVVVAAVTIASLLFKGQYIWVGAPLFPWQAAGAIGFSKFVLRSGPALRGQLGPRLRVYYLCIWAYFAYTMIVSLVMWTVFGTGEYGGTPEMSVARIATQSAYWGLLLGLVVCGIELGRTVNAKLLLTLIAGIATIAAAFAIVQVLIFYEFKINIFPIIGSDAQIRSAYILDTTFRATSFCGEPKHLGMVMAFGLMALFIVHLFRMSSGRFWIVQAALMTAALILSLSSTGIYLIVAGIGSMSIAFFKRVRWGHVFLLISCIVVLFFTGQFVSDEFRQTLGQQVAKGSFEVQDQSVAEALLNNPLIAITGAGLGNIHLIAAEYLPPDFPLFKDDAYKANSGFFFVLGDSGVIGLALLFIASAISLVELRGMRRWVNAAEFNQAGAMIALSMATFILFLLRFNEVYFLCCGLTMSVLAAGKRRMAHGITGDELAADTAIGSAQASRA